MRTLETTAIRRQYREEVEDVDDALRTRLTARDEVDGVREEWALIDGVDRDHCQNVVDVDHAVADRVAIRVTVIVRENIPMELAGAATQRPTPFRCGGGGLRLYYVEPPLYEWVRRPATDPL